MNKRLLTLALGGILAVSHTPLLFAETGATVHSTINHAELLTKRQVVDSLLNEAVHAYKSPAISSNAGFTAKLPSSMETITQRLLKAYELEPYRTDFVISAANAQIYNKNVEKAIELYKQALEVAPDSVDIHSYLAVWEKFQGNEKASLAHLDTLSKLNPARKADLEKIFATVETVAKIPLKDKPDAVKEGNNAIVTLGYALEVDGSMNDILIKRLETTLKMAQDDPNSIIILTGGVPKNNKTEGKLMADWLIEKGISADRIIEENYATSTIDNALFSSYALARHKIDHATIISSASHVRRGQSLFEIASWSIGPANITFDTVAYPDKPLDDLKEMSKGELLGIYRDALRVYGMWSYRSYPLEYR